MTNVSRQLLNKLIEFVPNISEGRDQSIVAEIGDCIRGVDGIRLLNINSDSDHNRSVFTIIGDRDSLTRCALVLYHECIAKIDLTKHTGIHPRIGAVDVAPFVPLGNSTMAECIALASTIGKMIAAAHQLPVYLYSESALSPDRRKLANIRSGVFERLNQKVSESKWAPDFGPLTLHPTAGATVVGARSILVAYNIILNTSDISIAKSIAKSIRESSGGLAGVQAIGLHLGARGLTQVSMNLLDYRKTSIPEVQKAVYGEAKKLGVEIVDAEIIGMIPRDALAGESPENLKIANFSEQLILDNWIALPF